MNVAVKDGLIDTSAARLVERSDSPAPPAVIVNNPLLLIIDRAARDPSVDIEKVERLMKLYNDQNDKIKREQAESEFIAAMAAAQKEMEPVNADATNPETHSRYATYAQLDRALRPIYTKHGFSLSFDEEECPKANHVRVVCYCSHVGGFTRKYRRDMAADGKGPKGGAVMTLTHASGSAFSYGQRYILRGIFNVAVGADPEERDDGNAAGGGGAQLISADQVSQLEQLVKDTGSHRGKLLAYLKIRSFEEIPASNFDFACGEVRRADKARREKAARDARPTQQPRTPTAATGRRQ